VKFYSIKYVETGSGVQEFEGRKYVVGNYAASDDIRGPHVGYETIGVTVFESRAAAVEAARSKLLRAILKIDLRRNELERYLKRLL